MRKTIRYRETEAEGQEKGKEGGEDEGRGERRGQERRVGVQHRHRKTLVSPL